MDFCIKNRFFIFIMTALNLTLVVYKYISGNAAFIYAGFAVFLSAVVLAGIIDILFIKFKLINKIIKYILVFLSAVMFLADMFALYYYKCRFDAGMLDVIFGTKPNELFEFFDVYIFNSGLIKFFIIAFICMAFLFFIYAKISRNKIFWSVALIIALICSVVNWREKYYNGFGKKCISPFRLFDMLYDVQRETRIFNDMLRNAKNDVNITLNNSAIPYVVFILGESTTRNHMSLYGYELDTTPLLNARKNNGELYVFSDVISPNAHTIPVMEKLFTFYGQGAQGRWFSYTSLFNILRAAGYKTFWLSNQETFGKYSRAGRFYAGQDDISRFVMAKDSFTSMSSASYDEKLLPLLDEALLVLNNGDAKNFYMLHIMGTHSKYAMRYPENFKKFVAQDEGGFSKIDLAQKDIRAHYDNAVLYNDFFINEVIKRFENKNAIVIYISDHGEEVYDTRAFAGHGERNISRSMIEIPMLIWTSEKFNKNYPVLRDRIKRSVDRPFMTDDMIHVILDLTSIETVEYDATKSVINDNFDDKRERVYNGKIYNKITGLD